MSADIFVSIFVIYYLLINYFIFGSYNQHSMLDLPKENSALLFLYHQYIFSNNYIGIYGKLKKFSQYSLQ